MLKKIILSLSLFTLSLNALASDAPLVRMTTSLGDIEIELNPKKAPKTVENFLHYVENGQYNGLIFHRVIKDFMIQGGGFDKNLKRAIQMEPIPNEAYNGLKNDFGTIAMARTNKPHSATNQFFINTKKSNNDLLNHRGKTPRGWGYAVFGKVTKGIDVVKKIENVKTGASGQFNKDFPKPVVIIKKMEIIRE